ncbi:dTDP-4-amino-4,6-dideoxygalactose transaminase [Vibrio salinus]|uniref:dTDP-4-amino-4,6-dideoxygalactose transaminase n=1 Tax=Vibrio salinus TaxID=2899784 RepID=UPI001E368F4F|nr:dTDP-4-amino-4,6-dideoxygalactose transaminase [Vibrio salinus]MCE0493763.1 dTDP-4-amino-4,6-dideoxygalactose transaminase [Vibrio salinus]
MISFNKPPFTGNEEQYVIASMRSNSLAGNGPFSKKCQDWFEKKQHLNKVLLTPSCTHSLEMAALLLDIKPGDEVIVPSYTFVTTANAFVLRGAKIVFVDIRPDTMNIDEKLIEEAITSKTKVIVPVHYAGVACEMDSIMALAEKYGLYVVEDAAQGMMATYKGRPLGSIGHIGAISFHETKNYTSGGEGGLLIINDKSLVERAEIIRDKGTNRSQFFRGMVDKYSWVDLGSSYLPSDIQAAYLWGQLEKADEINKFRCRVWDLYFKALKPLSDRYIISEPHVPIECEHNAHMFYIKVSDLSERTKLIDYLGINGVNAVFHYVPLHSSSAGNKFGRFCGEDRYTTEHSEKLVRLPIWYGITDTQINFIIDLIYKFFDSSIEK